MPSSFLRIWRFARSRTLRFPDWPLRGLDAPLGRSSTGPSLRFRSQTLADRITRPPERAQTDAVHLRGFRRATTATPGGRTRFYFPDSGFGASRHSDAPLGRSSAGPSLRLTLANPRGPHNSLAGACSDRCGPLARVYASYFGYARR